MTTEGTAPSAVPADETWDGVEGKWWILVAMTGALSMVLIDATVVSVALPSIQHDLGMSTAGLQWVVNAYLLTLASIVALGGRLGEIFGRRTLFMTGIVVFVVASAASGASDLANSGELLVAARAVQGLGAALMLPASQAIVTSSFPVHERGTAMGIYAGISVAALALGPLVGGVLTELVGWEWVFYVNLPVGVATIALTVFAHPENAKQQHARLDRAGAPLLVFGLAALVIGLMQSTSWGWGDPRTLGVLIAGSVLVAVFCFVELHTDQPLIDLRLFRSGNFSVDITILFLVQFALMGTSVFGSIFAQDVLGFDPIQAGFAMLPLTIPILLLATLVGRTYDRVGPRILVSAGCFAAALGNFATALFITEIEYWLLVPGYVLVGAGVAMIMTPSNTDAMNTSPEDKRSEAAGLIQTARQVGGTIGVAVLTTLIVSTTNRRLDDNLAELGISGTEASKLEGVLADAQRAGESSDAVLGRFSGESPEEITAVIDASSEAFAEALRLAFLTVGVLLAVGVVLAAALLRKVAYTDRGGIAVGL